MNEDTLKDTIRLWADLNNDPETGGFEQSFIDALVDNIARGVLPLLREAEVAGLDKGLKILENYWDWSAMSDIITDDFEKAKATLSKSQGVDHE